MTAINLAVRALQTGDCRSTLVGGVNTITSPDVSVHVLVLQNFPNSETRCSLDWIERTS